MVSSFQLGYYDNPEEQNKYYSTEQAIQVGQEEGKLPYGSVVLPTIFKNTETLGDYSNNLHNIEKLNAAAQHRQETMLTTDELAAKYPGVSFSGPMYAGTAEHIAQRQARLQQLEYVKEHSSTKIPGAMFVPEIASYIGKSFTDPMELGLMVSTALLTEGAGLMFPQLAKLSGVGLAHKMAGKIMPQNALLAQMSMAELPFSIRTAGRFYEGFMENAVANAALEPWMASASRQLGDDYTGMNSMMNILVGGLTGGVFHTGMGLTADPFMRNKTHEKMKAVADYIALRENGEDGALAHMQNLIPATSLSARDIMLHDGIKITELPNGQYAAKFKNEVGLLRNHEGIIGRTPGDAIRNLQYTYATVMQDGILYKQLNDSYNIKSEKKVADPFKESSTGVQMVKNANTIVKGGIKHKLQFDSYIDKMFFNIHKILANPANKDKTFEKVKYGKDVLDNSIKWITENVGDSTEAEIKAQAKNVFKAVHQQIRENLNQQTGNTEVRIAPFIKNSEIDAQPGFMTKEAWQERLQAQRTILNNPKSPEAFNLLEELHKYDYELQQQKLEKLEAARSDIQKLISTSEDKLRLLSEREVARKEVIDTIQSLNTNITEPQLIGYLQMLDIVTGDFSKWLKEHNVSFVSEKEFQAQAEKRLNQTVEKELPVRKQLIDDYQTALEFYTLPIETIEQNSYAQLGTMLSDKDIGFLIDLKGSKNQIQETLYGDYEMDGYASHEINKLDSLIKESRIKEDTVFFRGIPKEGVEALRYADVKPGMTIQSPGFLSVTGHQGVAMGFAMNGGQPTILRVKTPRGMFGLDVEAALGENLRFSKYNKFLNHETHQQLMWDDNFKMPEGFSDYERKPIEFTLSNGIEDEVILPRDMALKVLNVEEVNGTKFIDVTPDSTLNNLYGTNAARDNIDVLFQTVNERKQTLYTALEGKEVGSPEHFKILNEAFNQGAIIPQHFLDLYPELRIKSELTNEIPSEWLFQAAERRPLANRIIGEFTNKITFEQFDNLYGSSFVYKIGEHKYTRYPDIAIAKTGRAVLYDIGEGYRFAARLQHALDYEEHAATMFNWEPASGEFLNKSPEHRELFIKKVLSEADTMQNKQGVSFKDYIKSLGGKKRDTYSKLDVENGELIFDLEGKAKQLGEPSVLKEMKAEDAMNLSSEVIYKSLIMDDINKVEDLQVEVTKAKKFKEKSGGNSDELVKHDKVQAKKVKNLEKEVEIAKKEREKVINSVNDSQPEYNKIIKGAVDISNDNKYIIGLFQHADLSTLVHETAHVFRRTVLDADLLEQAENALGVKNGKWTTEAEEKFAQGFEKYLTEGKSTHAGLKGLFEEFKNWLTDIYINLTQTPLDSDLSPELRKVFDELFAERKVELAEEAGFKNADQSKKIQMATVAAYKDQLATTNKTIKATKKLLKEGEKADTTAYERLRQQKLQRIESKLDMLSTPEQFTTDEIRDKIEEARRTINENNAEAIQLADSQFLKSKDATDINIELYADNLELEEASYNNYIKALNVDPEYLAKLEGELEPELQFADLDREQEEISLLEGVLREFGECSRGELNG